jgi:hypothetical protein
MSETEEIQLSGKCLCGAITFKARSKDGHVGACHCKMCRTWSGGVLFALQDAHDVTIDGEDNLGIYKSSDWGERCFCKTCGSNLFWRSETFKYLGVMAGSIVEEDKLKFVQQIYTDGSPGYYSFAEPTKNMTEADFVAHITAITKS